MFCFPGSEKTIRPLSFVQLTSLKIVPVNDQDNEKEPIPAPSAPVPNNDRNAANAPGESNRTNAQSNMRGNATLIERGKATVVENTLEEAAHEGQKLRFRITMFACCSGLLLSSLVHALSNFVFEDHSYLGAFFSAFGPPCLSIIGLGVMKDDVVFIRAINLFGAIATFLVGSLLVFSAYSKWFFGDVDVCGSHLPKAGCVAAVLADLSAGLTLIAFGASLVPNLQLVKDAKIFETNGLRGWKLQDHAFKIPSRQALPRSWYNWRWFNAILGLLQLCYALAAQSLGDRYPFWSDERFAAKMGLLCSNSMVFFVFTSKNRGRITAFLGTISTKGETRSAASIAALLGNVKASESLAMAQDKFRSIAFNKLEESDFESNREGANNENVLFGKTDETRLGKCDAFISHSWSDNGKQKYAALKQWCQDFKSENGREPQLWLDKACINQKDISSDLLCLPVFLAGCETLLIIPGPTYTSRLWCIMEVFVFLKMGGSIQRITIIPIELRDEKTAREKFEEVDVSECKCYVDKDRQKLLGIVEKGFGSYEAFNKAFRNVFDQRISTIISPKNMVSTTRVSIYRVDDLEED